MDIAKIREELEARKQELTDKQMALDAECQEFYSKTHNCELLFNMLPWPYEECLCAEPNSELCKAVVNINSEKLRVTWALAQIVSLRRLLEGDIR